MGFVAEREELRRSWCCRRGRRPEERRFQHIPDEVDARGEAEFLDATEKGERARSEPRRGRSRINRSRRQGQQERPGRKILRGSSRARAGPSQGLRGHPPAQGRGVAVPPPIPDRVLRYLPRPREPGYPVGSPGVEPGHGVPPRLPLHQHRLVAPPARHPRLRLRHLHPRASFYFEAIRREYFHPVRVNFFFAPWIACMFLAIGTPPRWVPKHLHPAVWCAFIAPVFVLELKIYGQWLSGGKRRLCKVANPSSHLSVVGNFVGAILAAKVGWGEAGKFLWAVGLAHYVCVFVTLYQRLPTNEALPKELHPVYSMFIATPSAASIAWTAVYGEFDAVSTTFYFIALFLYCSRRPHQFLQRIQVLGGMVVVHVSDDDGFARHHQVRGSGSLFRQQGPGPEPLAHVLRHGVSAVRVDAPPRIRLGLLVPNDLAIAITKSRNGGAKAHGKEKKADRKGYDIKRWAKQSPLSLVSSIRKGNLQIRIQKEVKIVVVIIILCMIGKRLILRSCF
ncbi:hypothetical protein MUK42_05316 [Musa troglodytarum]|uniref:Uncharacterized protein n=1 Tax=Musa troglodytarum TaxID=320322 RepID=A0A9E7EV88_9LILI|nr:hypothetical protein MUK42_05316 [Musa troglodytarum]